jgi:preprotein translocase subunit YajC
VSVLPGIIPLQADPVGGGIMSFLPFILIFFIFYFLLIRPQQKRQQQQEAMLQAIEKGDNVVTSGGIHGKVTGVTDDVLTVEVAAIKGERIRLKVARAKIDSVLKAKGEES